MVVRESSCRRSDSRARPAGISCGVASATAPTPITSTQGRRRAPPGVTRQHRLSAGSPEYNENSGYPAYTCAARATEATTAGQTRRSDDSATHAQNSDGQYDRAAEIAATGARRTRGSG